MKKAILFIAALTVGLSFSSHAQDKYVVSANVAMQQGNLDEAKENIDKAIANPETSEKPKALWAKAQIYNAMAAQDKYKMDNPAYECVQALIKLAEVKPDYEKEAVNHMLRVYMNSYYNNGVSAYNDKNNTKRYAEVADTMREVLKMADLNGGRRFEKVKAVDTARAYAVRVLANSYFLDEKYDAAIPWLLQVKNNPITKTPAAYENLIESYEKTNNKTDEEAVIKEGRTTFPDDAQLRNDELNFFIVSGKQDDLIKKLEEAVAKDPNSADLQISLATAYSGEANPKDGKKPANSNELTAKAETAYIKSVTLAPDNAEFNYYTGAFFFNQGKAVNDDMNAITGTSDADQKKYDELKAKRDAIFNKSLPYMEKAYDLLDAKSNTGKMTSTEQPLFSADKQALYNIYLILDKTDKAAALKAKMAAGK